MPKNNKETCNYQHTKLEKNGPQDNYYLVYQIFFVLGIGTLLPWNFFTTAKQYFYYKFRNCSLPSSADYSAEENLTDLQITFENYLAVFSNVPNVLFMYMNAVATKGVKVSVRFILGISIIIAIFGVTIGFININTDEMQTTFFWITQFSVVFMNAGSALMQGSLFGLGSLFPPRYMGAIMNGQAIGGICAALTNIAILSASFRPQNSALIFFLVALLIVVICLLLFCLLLRLPFAKFHLNKDLIILSNVSLNTSEDEDTSESDTNKEEIALISSSHPTIWKVITLIYQPALAVFSIFALTLSLYPAFIANINSMHRKHKDPWTDIYFTPVVCFLLFNLTDFFGRFLASFIMWPRRSSVRWLLPLSLLRLIFVPLFIFTNYQPRHHLSVLLSSDVWPIVLVILFGLSNGYLSTMCMIIGPTVVPQAEETGGALMSFFLTCGLAAGASLSFLYPTFI